MLEINIKCHAAQHLTQYTLPQTENSCSLSHKPGNKERFEIITLF